MSTPTEEPTVEQIVRLADSLSLYDKVRVVDALMAYIARAAAVLDTMKAQMADEKAAPPTMTVEEGRAVLDELREHLRTMPGPRLNLGEQLDADRRDRDRALLGEHHVDP